VPWFSKKSEEERRQEEEIARAGAEAQADQEASLRSLERGGLPVQAQRRLTDLRERGAGLFTSDLSVNEFMLGRQAGLEAVTQVMGSSVYHVGWQFMPSSSWWQASQELTVISEAMNRARALALSRMEQEARMAGADAVVGVRVERTQYDWARDLIEFNLVGTAVRVPGAPRNGGPIAITNLSGQDFWKLLKSGYWPLGVVAASTVFYVVASWRTQMANNSWWGSGWANQELTDFTQGLYTARHIAMSHVHQQASAQRAGGVVGTMIEEEADEYEVDLGNDNERTDMIFTFHVIGTAITELAERSAPPPTHQVVDLRS
jgi:uncharacterized protein YbjQ (UPF0145 family)